MAELDTSILRKCSESLKTLSTTADLYIEILTTAITDINRSILEKDNAFLNGKTIPSSVPRSEITPTPDAVMLNLVNLNSLKIQLLDFINSLAYIAMSAEDMLTNLELKIKIELDIDDPVARDTIIKYKKVFKNIKINLLFKSRHCALLSIPSP